MQIKEPVKRFVKRVKRQISRIGHHHREQAPDGAVSTLLLESVCLTAPIPIVISRSQSGSSLSSKHKKTASTSTDTQSTFSGSTARHSTSPSETSYYESADAGSSFIASSTSGESDYDSAVDKLPRTPEVAAIEPQELPSVLEISEAAPEPEVTVIEVATPSSAMADAEHVPAPEQELAVPVEEVLAFSPPPVIVEPEVPDPFLVDDPEEPLSDDNDEAAHVEDEEERDSVVPADEIALAQSTILAPAPAPAVPAAPSALLVNKPVPPAPTAETNSDSEEDSDSPPELYLPGLTIPTMFLPIPNVRFSSPCSSLTWWLSPARGNSSFWYRSPILSAISALHS